MQPRSLQILRRAANSLRLTGGVLFAACAYAAVLAYYAGGCRPNPQRRRSV